MKRLKTLADLRREDNWEVGKKRTCPRCGGVFMSRKSLRIHLPHHRTKMEDICEKTVIT